jgi:UDP-glucose 4-epimerase
METEQVTHVIHLAALLTPACQHDPFIGCQVNVLGSTAVFDAARRSGRVQAIAYASSYAVYGDGTELPPTFYGAYKQAVDRIAEQYWQHFGLRSLAVRPHVVYGPERDLGLTAGPSLACRAAARGEPYHIGYRGLVGYDYVEDVANVFVRGVLDCPPGANIVDMPSESATTVEFASRIMNVVPEAAGRITVGGPFVPPNIPPTQRPLRELFPEWQPTTLSDGIARTIDFYRQKGS